MCWIKVCVFFKCQTRQNLFKKSVKDFVRQRTHIKIARTKIMARLICPGSMWICVDQTKKLKNRGTKNAKMKKKRFWQDFAQFCAIFLLLLCSKIRCSDCKGQFHGQTLPNEGKNNNNNNNIWTSKTLLQGSLCYPDEINQMDTFFEPNFLHGMA